MTFQQDTDQTIVVFRAYKAGDVLALFPEIQGDTNGHFCSCYAHVGQHSAADYNAYRRVVADFTDANGLAYIDLTDYPWTTGEFYDFLHVNSAGIALVNAMLADGLVAVGD